MSIKINIKNSQLNRSSIITNSSNSHTITKKKKKSFWEKYLIPTILTIIATIIASIIVYYITEGNDTMKNDDKIKINIENSTFDKSPIITNSPNTFVDNSEKITPDDKLYFLGTQIIEKQNELIKIRFIFGSKYFIEITNLKIKLIFDSPIIEISSGFIRDPSVSGWATGKTTRNISEDKKIYYIETDLLTSKSYFAIDVLINQNANYTYELKP